MQLRDKVVIVTGGGRGIGLALGFELERRGAQLHRVVRTRPKDDLNGRVWLVDMLLPDQIRDFVQNFTEELGAPDILINNAGLLTGGLLEEQEPKAIIDMLTVNLNHLILMTRLFLPGMLQAGRGKIVNNASISARMFFPCASTYAASKAGVLAFTECLKQEIRGTGVSTLLLVTPGVKTEMYDQIKDLYGKHLDVSFLSSIPAGEWAAKICDAVEDERDTLEPQSWSKLGLKFAQHLPALFERAVAAKFKRSKHGI